MNNTLIVLLGPTGVGKTAIAVELALSSGSEIISADSRQFYRELKIGTASPSDEQLQMVRHHFVQFIPVTEYYSSSLYERDVLALLGELFLKKKSAILTGGSGMYIDAVTRGIDEIPDTDPEIREKYNRLYLENGIESLRIALKKLDPEHYSKVDLRNHKRIIRALEICETAGRPYSSFLNRQPAGRNFDIVKIGLNMEREELYDRINSRVDRMVEDGLVQEARKLMQFRHLNALNTIGYRELFDYFDGKTSFAKAVELIKRNSRRYAKRQLTWWAADKQIKWFRPDQKKEIIGMVNGILKGAL